MSVWKRVPGPIWNAIKRRLRFKAATSSKIAWPPYSTKPGSYPAPEEKRVYRKGVKKRRYKMGYYGFRLARGLSGRPDLNLTGRLWNALSAQFRTAKDKILLRFFVRRVRYYGRRAHLNTADVAEFNALRGRNIMDLIGEEEIAEMVEKIFGSGGVVVDVTKKEIRFRR